MTLNEDETRRAELWARLEAGVPGHWPPPPPGDWRAGRARTAWQGHLGDAGHADGEWPNQPAVGVRPMVARHLISLRWQLGRLVSLAKTLPGLGGPGGEPAVRFLGRCATGGARSDGIDGAGTARVCLRSGNRIDEPIVGLAKSA